MVIAYTAKSKYSENIDSNNWYNILLKDNVKVGHSNPNLDPCGYRSILVVKLAEKYYKINNYYNQLLNYGDSYENGEENRSKIIVRPKETDLLGLLESGIIDYLFIYKSVAIQHNLKYVKLPNEIALNDINFSDFYSTVNFNITGSKPSNFITVTGKPIVYGITIPEDHKIYPNNKKGAIKFLNFILSEDGRKIMEDSGQNPIYPPLVTGDIIKNE
jgi:molybdate/tungstate transport system substrate-binding protein